MTAKNHHLVQDCLIWTERACLWASVQHKAFAGVASHIRWTLLQYRPFPHATHTYILGVRVGMFKKRKSLISWLVL